LYAKHITVHAVFQK